LQALPRGWIAEPAIFSVSRVEPQCQIGILEIEEHPVVSWEDHLRDELDVVHLERGFALKNIELAVVRAEAESAVLLRNCKNRGLEISERQPG
jgi:hypothetical protein